jgi:hypothetical protein
MSKLYNPTDASFSYMDRLGKYLSLCLVVILVTSILLLVAPVEAQTLSKLSLPTFTVKFVDSSYDIPATHTFDSYTGQEITSQGSHVEKKSIEIRIKNQPFEPFLDNGRVINLCYNVRIKGYFEQNWTELYRPVYGFPIQTNDSQYTVLSYDWAEGQETQLGSRMITLRNGAQADFQVEAMIGYNVDSGPFSGAYFDGETSGWTSTQSITIGEISPSPTVPEFSFLSIMPLLVVIPLITFFILKKRNCIKTYSGKN